MGKSSKTTTNQTSTVNQTQAPTNPSWVTDSLQNLTGKINDLSNADPYSFVAAPNDNLTQAGTSAGNLTGQPGYGQASDIYSTVAGGGANTYDPSTYGATGYTGQGYGAHGYTGQGYDAATGNAATYDAATGNASHATAQSLLDGLGTYMSPYTGQVVDSALKDYDFGAGKTQAQNLLALANDSVFGGSGGAIETAASNDAINRGRGSLSAQLRDQAFQTGANLSNLDAARRQDASIYNAGADNQFGLANMAALNEAGQFNAGSRNQFGLADMGALNNARQFGADANNTANQFDAKAANDAAAFGASAGNTANQFGAEAANAAGQFGATANNAAGQFNASAHDLALQRQLAAAAGLTSNADSAGNDSRQNIATQSAIGQILQQLAQNRATAPLATTGALASMYSALPYSLLHGQTANGTSTTNGTSNTTTSDPMGTFGSLLSAGGSLASGLGSMGVAFSDRRLKRDVVKLGERPDGLGVYLFRYLWSPLQYIGVMAQEVLTVKPEAVITLPSGFYAVDYGAL